MKKVENYLETLKLKKCLFGGIAPKQIEIVIQEICMLYDLELYSVWLMAHGQMAAMATKP